MYKHYINFYTLVIDIAILKYIYFSDMDSDGNAVFTPPPMNNTTSAKDQPPPLPTSPLPDEEEADNEDNKRSSVPEGAKIIVPTTERLIGGSSSTIVTTRKVQKTDHEDLIPPLPSALEHNVRVLKDSDTLGVQVNSLTLPSLNHLLLNCVHGCIQFSPILSTS